MGSKNLEIRIQHVQTYPRAERTHTHMHRILDTPYEQVLKSYAHTYDIHVFHIKIMGTFGHVCCSCT